MCFQRMVYKFYKHIYKLHVHYKPLMLCTDLFPFVDHLAASLRENTGKIPQKMGVFPEVQSGL